MLKVPVISVVDDDQSMRDATGRLVRSLGFAVATFASAEDFLASARVDDTLCLITDVQMPGLSGVELQSRLIADGRHMPIIGITAHPEESIRTQMLEAGAVGFLNKPFNDECLITCLATALKSRDTPTLAASSDGVIWSMLLTRSMTSARIALPNRHLKGATEAMVGSENSCAERLSGDSRRKPS